MNELKQLKEDQLESFNTEYVNGKFWDAIINMIDRNYSTGVFKFLDLGGGNGVFTDRILDRYPASEAVLLDNASNLIEINTKRSRKTIIMDSVENIETYLNEYSVDIVFINWVLHHLVSDTYKKTRSNIYNTLKIIKQNKNIKHVSVFENMYNGMLFDSMPGKLIYNLTSLRSIEALTRKMGANTAGVGVCFLSKKMWMNLLGELFGKDKIEVTDFHFWEVPVIRKILLQIKNIHMSLFWINNK